MIATTAGLQLGVYVAIELFGLSSSTTSWTISLLVWTLVPAAFLQFRLVDWPARLRAAPKLKLFLAGVPAICFIAVFSYASFSKAGIELAEPPIGALFAASGAMIIGATAEEVVFRVLFLTALLDRGVSRFQAVFLSSVAFAALHAPFRLLEPLVQADWPLLLFAVHTYAPLLLMQVIMGLILAVVWLRTGSISLISTLHAIANIGSMLAFVQAAGPAAMA